MNVVEFWTMIAGVGAVATAVATSLLVWVAKTGLKQIGVSKTDIVTRSQREALLTAIQQCDDFRTGIMSDTNIAMEALAASNMQLFTAPNTLELAFEAIPEETLKRAAEWVAKLTPDVYAKSIVALNHLEAFSMYFTTRLADSETAFKPTSDVFCGTVVRLYPLIIHLRRTRDAGFFTNLVSLYKDWSSRKSEPAKKAQVQFLQKQLEDMQTKTTWSKDYPKPLGTDL